MKLPRQLESLARMLAYMLGHHPDEFGLVLAEDGSIPIKELHQALGREPGWGFVRRHHLDQVVSLMQPPAFAVAEERIRALQPGPRPRRHPGLPPPPLLYLAIPPKVHAHVWQEGLKAAPGRELLLARTPDTALKLGKRRAPTPVLVTIQAQAAAQAGQSFTAYGEELFLAAGLPREFLQLPLPPAPEKKPPLPPAAPPLPLTPGSFRVEFPPALDKAAQGSDQKDKKSRKGKKGEPSWKAGARALRKDRRRQP
jgi:putative RNA 2'-phosphotransferase